MQKLLIYITLFLILIALQQLGLVPISMGTIGIMIGCFCFLVIAIFMYGFIKAGIEHRKTRKFWNTFQKNYDDLQNEEEEL